MKTADYDNFNFKDDAIALDIKLLGKEIKFFCPNNELMKNIVIGILKGNDYPILPIPNYTPKVILDIGANIGASAIYFVSNFPNAEIHCYEPSSKNYKYLQNNTKNFSNIKCYQYGLYKEDGQVKLFYGKDQSAQDSIVFSNETVESGETVHLVKASKEILNKGIKDISILKIDTEGCEIPILNEFDKLENLNIDMIYLEYHSEDDRLALDKQLSEYFLLFYSNARSIHRGTNGYISKKLCKRHSEMEWLKK